MREKVATGATYLRSYFSIKKNSFLFTYFDKHHVISNTFPVKNTTKIRYFFKTLPNCQN